MKKYLGYFLMLLLGIMGCQFSGNEQNNTQILSVEEAAPNLFYKVKFNGSSSVDIVYLDPESVLQDTTIQIVPNIINEWSIKFNTPADVKYISATVSDDDSTHSYLFVTANSFTKADKFFVEVSY